MNILEVTSAYPPTVNGTARCVSVWSHELARRGHQVTIMTPRVGSAAEYEEDGEVSVIRAERLLDRVPGAMSNPRQVASVQLPDPFVVRRLRSEVARLKPDVIHVHGAVAFSVWAAGLCRQVPSVLTMHDYEMCCPSGHLWSERSSVCDGPSSGGCVRCMRAESGTLRAIVRYVAFRTQVRVLLEGFHLTAVSYSVARSIAAVHGSFSRTVSIVRPCFTAQAGEPSDLRDPNERPIVLFAGDLSPKKGLHVFLRACHEIEPCVQVIIAGIRTKGHHWTGDLGVQLIENAPHDTVLQLMRRADVVVVPSLWEEPFGLVAQEAMGSGRPVVASDVGGLAEQIIHRENGMLVPRGDHVALVSAVKELLCDRELAQRLGSSARRTVAHRYSPERVMPEIEGVLHSAIRAT